MLRNLLRTSYTTRVNTKTPKDDLETKKTKEEIEERKKKEDRKEMIKPILMSIS